MEIHKYVLKKNTNIRLTHEYQSLDEYIIQIIGSHSYFSAPISTIEAMQVSNSLTSFNFGDLELGRISSLTKISNTFILPQSLTSCYAMFRMCNSLKTIPSSIVIPNSVTDCSWMFYNSNLYSLPKNFKLHENIKNAQWMFRNNSLLDFDITNFFPKFLNDNIDLYGLFENCSNIKGVVPADKLWDSGKTFNSTGCFRNCTSLTNYDEIPAGWK